MHWWLIIQDPAGDIRAWEVWADVDPPDEWLLNAARVAAGFPANDDWPQENAGWDIQLTVDRPHATLMERATIGTVQELRAVDADEVQAHADARAAATRNAHLDGLRSELALLDDDALAEVLGGQDAARWLPTVEAATINQEG